MNTTDPIQVQHNEAEQRFEVQMGGHLSVADYELEGNRMVFTHTYVPPELRGRGIAEKLVRTALEHARATQKRVVPACSYVAVFVQRNPDFAPLLA